MIYSKAMCGVATLSINTFMKFSELAFLCESTPFLLKTETSCEADIPNCPGVISGGQYGNKTPKKINDIQHGMYQAIIMATNKPQYISHTILKTGSSFKLHVIYKSPDGDRAVISCTVRPLK